MSGMVEITLDGRLVAAQPGTTVLGAAKQAGIEIPTLCYHPLLTPYGVCRLCVVEVEGVRSLQAACVTPVRPGMVVLTRSPRVDRARRTVLEMLASTVDLSASVELRNLIEEYQARPERFGGMRPLPPPIDDNPVYVRDYAKCVLCWRCVQACGDDMQFNYALTLAKRAFHTEVATYSDWPLPETSCVFCGNCVGVCPTGALVSKREYLLEQGLPAEEVLRQTRLHGKGQRSIRGPRGDGT